MANEDRFTGLAQNYRRYRPSYPAEALDWIIAEADLQAGDAAADIGAGTGIFSELLLQRGLRVFAAEPNADMRAQLQNALGQNPNLTLVPAPAENTGLAGGSVALVTAAQAFHWFDAPRFAAECRRILRPGGHVALVWNTRDEQSPLVQAHLSLWGRMRTSAGAHHNADPGTLDDKKAAFFAGGPPKIRLFPNPLTYTCESFFGHALSASYMPKPGDAARGPLLQRLEDFFSAYSQNGTLTMPFITEVYLGSPG